MITYLCGGINGLSDADCRDWREVAKEHLKTKTLDPMRRDYRGKEDDSVTEIVHGDYEDIDACDFILVNASKPSGGTPMEVHYAHGKGKLVFAFIDGARASPWLLYHSTAIFGTVAEAVGEINRRVAVWG